MINYGFLTTNILLHIIFMILFLFIFFYTISVQIEKHIVNNQIDFLINEFIGQSFSNLTNEEKQNIKNNYLSAFDNKEDLNNQDKLILKNNNEIYNKSLIYLVIIISILLFIVFIIALIYKWDFYNIKIFIYGGLVSLLFIGLTEILFLLTVTNNYIRSDPNKIREKIINTLYKSSQECTENGNCKIN